MPPAHVPMFADYDHESPLFWPHVEIMLATLPEVWEGPLTERGDAAATKTNTMNTHTDLNFSAPAAVTSAPTNENREMDGRYTIGKMETVCVCGCPLGSHTAARVKNAAGKMEQPCMDCDGCECFKKPRKVSKKAARKVTFGKMGNGHVRGDDGCQDIMANGKAIGTITRYMDEVGSGMVHEYRVSHYMVEWFDLPGRSGDEMLALDAGTPDGVDSFDVDMGAYHGCRTKPGDYDTARAAHTAAKNYARATVAFAALDAA